VSALLGCMSFDRSSDDPLRFALGGELQESVHETCAFDLDVVHFGIVGEKGARSAASESPQMRSTAPRRRARTPGERAERVQPSTWQRRTDRPPTTGPALICVAGRPRRSGPAPSRRCGQCRHRLLRAGALQRRSSCPCATPASSFRSPGARRRRAPRLARRAAAGPGGDERGARGAPVASARRTASSSAGRRGPRCLWSRAPRRRAERMRVERGGHGDELPNRQTLDQRRDLPHPRGRQRPSRRVRGRTR
jgi:hypothetical protein